MNTRYLCIIMKAKQKPSPVNYGAIRQGLLKRDGALDDRFRTKQVGDKRRQASKEACRKTAHKSHF